MCSVSYALRQVNNTSLISMIRECSSLLKANSSSYFISHVATKVDVVYTSFQIMMSHCVSEQDVVMQLWVDILLALMSFTLLM